jgi:hypothetical protein
LLQGKTMLTKLRWLALLILLAISSCLPTLQAAQDIQVNISSNSSPQEKITRSLIFNIIFSEDVTGFNSPDDDIRLNVSDSVAIGSINIQAISAQEYTVTLNAISGIGTLELIVNADAASSTNDPATTNREAFSIRYYDIDAGLPDTQSPSVLIDSSASSPLDGSSFTVDISFDEAVTGFTLEDIPSSNLSLSNFVGRGANYTVQATPTTFGQASLGPIAQGAAIDLAGNAGSASNVLEFDYPAATQQNITVQIMGPSVQAELVNPISFSVLFSEDVTGFDSADDISLTVTGTIIVGNITIQSTRRSSTQGSATNYEVLLSQITGAGTLQLKVLADVATSTTSVNTNMEKTSLSYTFYDSTVDRSAPSPIISSSVDSTLDGSTFNVNIEFGEDVSGFTLEDINSTNLTLGALTGSNGSYVIEVAPINYGSTSFGPINYGAVTDLAGNLSNRSNILTWDYPVPDTSGPTVIAVTGSNLVSTASFTLVFEFNEAINDFTQDDIEIIASNSANYSSLILTQLSPNQYQLSFSGVSGQGYLKIQIPAGKISDTSGNANELLIIREQAVDLLGPEITSSSASPHNLNDATSDPINGKTVNFTLRFNESVKDYDASKLKLVIDGDISALRDLPLSGIQALNSTSLTLPIAVYGGEGNAAIEVAPGALRDAAGNMNTNSYTTQALTVDVTTAELLSFDTSTTAIQFSPDIVYFEGEFSESVAGVSVNNVKINHVLDSFYAGFPTDLTPLVRLGGIEWISNTRFRIGADIRAIPRPSTLKLKLEFSLSWQDLAGNPGSRNVSSASYAQINLNLPTAILTSTLSSPTNQEIIPVVITFSTSVTGLELNDFTVKNGSIGNLKGSGGEYSLELTPTAAGDVSISLNANTVTDTNGVANQQSSPLSFNFDNQGPTAISVAAADAANPNNHESFLVYFKFDETLTKFGAKSLFSAVISGLVNTGSLASVVSDPLLTVPGYEVLKITHISAGGGTVDIQIPAGAITDVAGNPNEAAFGLPAPIVFDRVKPTASFSVTHIDAGNPIAATSDSISASEVTFIVKFNEAVAQLTESAFEVSASGGVGYTSHSFTAIDDKTAQFTLKETGSDGKLTLKLRPNRVSDLAGNYADTASFEVSINNIATEVISAIPEAMFIRDTGSTFDFIVNWRKPVFDFNSNDISILGEGNVKATAIIITPISSLSQRVSLTGIDGLGEFYIGIKANSVVDSHKNPNFNDFYSPSVTRQGTLQAGPFDIDWLGGQLLPREDGAGYIVRGAPEFIINQQYILTDGYIDFDGVSTLTLVGVFKTPTGQILANGTTTINTDTGKVLFNDDASSHSTLTLGEAGSFASFQACSGQFLLGTSQLTLSGKIRSTMLPNNYLNGVVIAPKISSRPRIIKTSRLSLDSKGTCSNQGLTFEILEYTELAHGFTIEARSLNDLREDASPDPILIQGNIIFDAATDWQANDFTLQASGFNWQLASTDIFPATTTQVAGITLNTPSFEQVGLQFTLNDLSIFADLHAALPSELIAKAKLPDLELPGEYVYPTVLTMQNPILGNKLISSSQSTALFDTISTTTASIRPDQAVKFSLPHTVKIGTSNQVYVETATLDGEAYRAPLAKITTDLGDFKYKDIVIYLEKDRGTQGETVSTPLTTGIVHQGLTVQRVLMPFNLQLADDGKTWGINYQYELSLPADFPMDAPIFADGNLSGSQLELPVRNEWCYAGLPAGIPYTNFQINPFCMVYSEPPPTWEASIFAVVPVSLAPRTILTIKGDIKIINAKWDSLHLNASGFEIPIGTTGGFFTAVDAGLYNMAQEEVCVLGVSSDARTGTICSIEPVEFRGQADFVYGPKLTAPKVGELPIRPIAANVGMSISNVGINVNGNVFLLHPISGIKLGDAQGGITFAGPTFNLKANRMVFPGLSGSASLAGGNLYVNGELIATLQIPKEVPIIGDFTVAEISMSMNTEPVMTVIGYFEMFGARFTVAIAISDKPEIYFPSSKKPSYMMARQINEQGTIVPSANTDAPQFQMLSNFSPLQSISHAMPTTTDLNALSVQTDTITLTSNNPTLITLTYANSIDNSEFIISGPEGDVYTPSNVETNPNVQADVGYFANPVTKTATFVFATPIPGDYRIEVANASGLGEYRFDVLIQNASPTFKFINSANNSNKVFLDWQASDIDDDAQITFYLDTNREGLDGELLAGPFSEDSESSAMIDLDISSKKPGYYWVYAQIDDRHNAPVTVYSNNPLFIANPQAAPAVRNIKVSATKNAALVEWAPSTDPNISGYVVKWTQNVDDNIYEHNQAITADLNHAVISGLEANSRYKFTVVALKEPSETLGQENRQPQGPQTKSPVIQYSQQIPSDQAKQLARTMTMAHTSPIDWHRSSEPSLLTSRIPESRSQTIIESFAAEFVITETKASPGHNNAPRFDSEPHKTVSATGSYHYDVLVSDIDNTVPSVSLISGPDGMTLNGNTLSWEPLGEAGVYDVILEVSDGVDTQRQSWELTAANIFADKLRIVLTRPNTLDSDGIFEFQPQVAGGCGNPISYQLLMAPDDMIIDIDSGLVRWQPTANEDNDQQFVVLAEQICQGQQVQSSRQYFIDLDKASTTELIALPATCANSPSANVIDLRDKYEQRNYDDKQPINSDNVQVEMQGTPPFSLIWSNGEYMDNISSDSISLRLAFDQNKEPISLIGFADANCKGDIEPHTPITPPPSGEMPSPQRNQGGALTPFWLLCLLLRYFATATKVRRSR